MPSIVDEEKVLELLEQSIPQKGTYVVMPIKDFVLNVIANASTELVRCRDCACWNNWEMSCKGQVGTWYADSYCSNGRKREPQKFAFDDVFEVLERRKDE